MEQNDRHESEIGEAIRRIRIRNGFSLEDVAGKANLSPTSVRALELGRGSTLSTLIKVLRVMDETDLFTDWIEGSKEVSPIMALQASRKENTTPRRVSRKTKKERIGDGVQAR